MNYEIIKKDIRRYLGSNTFLDDFTESKIDLFLNEINKEYEPRHIYGIYDIEVCDEQIMFKDTNLLIKSKDLSEVLKDSDRCILIACTLGLEIERKLKFLSVNDLEMGILYDAIAGAYIEGYCDKINDEFEEQYSKDGKYLTMRYSPGYGDVGLEYQRDIINILQATKRIGLTTNDSYLMIPRKSITAFIGIQDTPYDEEYIPCESCRLKENCEIRKGGKTCGIPK